jgi:lysozyme family protein
MDRGVIDDLIAELEEAIASLQSRPGNSDVIAQLHTQIQSLRQRYTEE